MHQCNTHHIKAMEEALLDFDISELLEMCNVTEEEALTLLFQIGVLDVPPWLQSKLEQRYDFHGTSTTHQPTTEREDE